MSARARRRVPRSARRRSARLPALVLAAGLVAALVTPLGGLAAPAAAETPRAVAADVPAIRVTSFGPTVAKPGGTLTVAGSVTAGAESISSSALRLRVSTSAVATRAELAALTAGDTQTTGLPVAGGTTDVDLKAGASTNWSFSADLDTLGLGAAGVYPVTLTLDSLITGATTTQVTTFLSWFPDGSIGQPTKVAWVLPLVGTPARDADGVFLDEETAVDVSAQGRLRAVLDAGRGQPVSWLVDPDLLDAVNAMAGGYEVREEGGGVRPGGAAGRAGASTFLQDARTALAEADVSSLGYADPDVNALQRAGLTDDITLATTTGPALAQTLLGRDVRSDLAAPPGGAVERSTLKTLRTAGIRSVLLASSNVSPDVALPYTPTGLARLSVSGGNVTAVLSDDTLSGVVGVPEQSGGPALARARYLAETLVITQQRPSEPRTMVVAPPRDWDVDSGFARDLVGLSRTVPWLDPSDLSTLLGSEVPDVPRGAMTFPDATRDAELSEAQTNGARRLGRESATFTDVLVDSTAAGARYTNAVLRTVSGAFRIERAAGAALLAASLENVERDTAQVRVLSRGTVTLSGANGQVPITVANDLDQAVEVEVRLVPSSAVRLRVDQPGMLRLGARKKETIEVSARAATGGTVPVDVVLLTRNGEVYDDPVTIQVRSTAYSRVGLAVVVVALAALLLLVAARLFRRLRGSRS